MGCGCSIFHRSHTAPPSTNDLPLERTNSQFQSSVQLSDADAGPHIAPAMSEGPTVGDDANAQEGVLVAATNSFVTVFPTSFERGPVPTKDDSKELSDIRSKCPRFRILIIGKANAGKTTILQKMCNTTEMPIIHNQDGEVIDQSVIQPTDARGIHDINNELTFSSNPDFVFHDSPGFEAGSASELENVRTFIAERAARHGLGDQLHIIWYCLPLDNDRPLCDAEMTFFEQGTGSTPVVAIFTKYDGLILKEYNRLRFEENCTKKVAGAKAQKCADKAFQESDFYLKRLLGVPYPPARSIRVQDMQKPETHCAELSRQTLEALDSKILQQLFVSVQQNNMGLCAEFAIKEYVLKAVKNSVDGPIDHATTVALAKDIVACFRHMTYSDDYSYDEYRHGYQALDSTFIDNYDDVLQALELPLPSMAAHTPPAFQTLLTGIGILILVEDSFWLKKQGGLGRVVALERTLRDYQSSSKHPAVVKELLEEFGGADLQSLVSHEEGMMVKNVLEVVRKFSVQN